MEEKGVIKPEIQQESLDKEKQKLLEMSEISLWLDTYDDIFSDFDPRPYSQRALSDDFLTEAKKASIDKESGKIELKFLIAKDKRNSSEENTIIKRLRAHFRKHLNMAKLEVELITKKGYSFIIVGIFLMLIASYLIYKNYPKNIFASFLITLLEPAGWFLFWEGLNHLLYRPQEKRKESEFYKKMSESEITFLSY